MCPNETVMQQSEARKVHLEDIRVDEDFFQLREPLADGAKASLAKKNSRDHVERMAEHVLRTRTLLDPVTLWRSDQGDLLLVDGHHRLKAYRRVARKGGGWDQMVPVRFLPSSTTRREARRQALAANRKDHLSMTPAQKTQAAWVLICSDSQLRALTSRRAADMLGGIISHTTVETMKKKWEEMREAGTSKPEAHLWKDVRSQDWKGGEEFDLDQWRTAKIEKLAADLGASLLKHGAGDSQLMSEALEMALDEIGFEADVRISPSDHLLEEDAAPDY